VPTIPEDIESTKALTVAQVSAFHQKFYGASNGDVAISGDFDDAATRAALATAFGNWTAPEPYARLVHRSAKIDSSYAKIETPDKQMAMFLAVQPVPMKGTDPDWVALRVADFIFGESPLSDRVGTRLRQKEGLSYGAGSQIDTDIRDPSGAHMTFAIYAPQNADRLVAAYREELDRALKDGFTEEEVAKARQSFIETRFQARSDNGNLPGMAILRAENGLTFSSWDATIEDRAKKLTVAEVNAAFRKWITAKNVAWIVAGDFEGAKKKAPTPKP
jgi:zinc protease